MMPNTTLSNALKLMKVHVDSFQREVGFILSSKQDIANKVQVKDQQLKVELQKGTKSLVEGALLVHIYAIWDHYMPNDFVTWLTPDEKIKFNAYRHIRNTFAHGHGGKRADRYKQEFENTMPFDGVIWDKVNDTIDLSEANVAYNFYQFLGPLNQQLVVRFYNDERPTP